MAQRRGSKRTQRKVAGTLALAAFACLSNDVSWVACAQGPSGSEDGIRAALVQHLTLYVEWPGWKMNAEHAQFNVCLIGADPIGPALRDAFRDRPILQKPVVVIHLSNLNKIQDCHVLYIGATAKRDVQRNAALIEQAAVLTVSERSNGDSAGQVIGLPRDDNHVKIEVNLRTAATSKLVISSRLLRLATITEKP